MPAVAADYDNDGWPDVYVACDSTPSWLFRNQHDGTFRQEGPERGVALSEDGLEQAGRGRAGVGAPTPSTAGSTSSRRTSRTTPTCSTATTAPASSPTPRSAPGWAWRP